MNRETPTVLCTVFAENVKYKPGLSTTCYLAFSVMWTYVITCIITSL